MSTKISVIGAGSWGSAIANVLANNNYQVNLWVLEKDLCKIIKEKKENSFYLPHITLSGNIIPTTSLETAGKDTKILVIAVPTQHVRKIIMKLAPGISPNTIIISASKGIENSTLMTVSQIIKEILADKKGLQVLVLSGPTFAREVAIKLPAAASIAGEDRKTAEYCRNLFLTSWFKIFINPDILGVELGGALKNVIAIATGISDGLKLGDNTRAALITRGLVEISRLGTTLGANTGTFLGLSGVGDLVLTCTGDLSRNRAVGLALANGKKIDEIQTGMKMIAEGIKTVKSAYELGKKHNVRISIIDEIYNIIYQNKEINKAITDLLGREIIDEF